MAARAQSAFDPGAIAQPKSRVETPFEEMHDRPPPVLAAALERTSLKPGQLYGFTVEYAMTYTLPEPSSCAATVYFEPEPLPRPMSEDEIVVIAIKRSRENDWQITPRGERRCTRVITNFIESVRKSFDRGDGILFAIDPTAAIAPPFEVLREDARELVVETGFAPTSRTPRSVRKVISTIRRAYTIDKATNRVVRTSDRLVGPESAFLGLVRFEGFDGASRYGVVSALCCAWTNSETRMSATIAGRTQNMTITSRLTEIRQRH